MALTMLAIALLDLFGAWFIFGLGREGYADNAAWGRHAFGSALIVLAMAVASAAAAWAWHRGRRHAQALTFLVIALGTLLALYNGQRPTP